MATVLLIDDGPARPAAWTAELEAARYRIVADPGAGVAPDAIVLVLRAGEGPAWKILSAPMAAVPVIAIVGPGALEDGLRAAIEGAVRCLLEPLEASTLAGALDAVLAADAPSPWEQQRRARQRALEVLARIEARGAASDDAVHPRLVHLTRLEHAPVRTHEPDAFADARARLAALTPKQRSLLALVEHEGGVTAAAARLETSRGNVYAGLRRIVHRLGMRNTGELLRLLGTGELLRSARS